MRAKRIVPVILVLVTLACAVSIYWPFRTKTSELVLAGTVEIQEVRLSSRFGGRVKHVAVREGEYVNAGRVLVTFDVPELAAQRAQAVERQLAMQANLDKARNGVTPEVRGVAEASVIRAEAHLARVKAKARPEEVEQLEQELKALTVELDYAQREWEREKYLNARGTSSDSKLEATRTTHSRIKANHDATAAKLKLLLAGARCEEIAEAEAALAQAKAQRAQLIAPTRSEDLAEWTAKVAELGARIRELDAMLAEATVLAPEPCLVEVVAVRAGDVLNPNQAVVRVVRADDLWVKAYVPATKLGMLKLNQAVEITIDSHPGRRFSGTIAYIAAVSEFTPRNVQTVDERSNQVFAIKVRVPDTEGIFKAGMAADVHVRLEGER